MMSAINPRISLATRAGRVLRDDDASRASAF
jgi:hypothetical protein